ncbi:FixH family protein [Nodularia spumigena]|uniref:FixH family protein n=1 Tax=Nodularia spumigena TaxID=70799 RepID=UPI002B20922F|nr:FixH family protein [Nodularia spumigena]MEA5556246.1 FixH family protein [Nodularia spumigena CH309]
MTIPARTEPKRSLLGQVRRVPRMLWMVFGLLCMNFTIVAITVTRATGDPHMAVEPNYYERAVAWDDSVRATAASDALGWVVAVDSAVVHTDAPGRVVTIRLTDAGGEPVIGAAVTVCVFHHAYARVRVEIACEEVGNGVYRTQMTSTPPGLHEVQVRAVRGEQRFEHHAEIMWSE